MDQKNKSLWGGRFNEPTDTLVEEFTSSINFDKSLYKYDIAGSIAHASMLNEVDILNKQEVETIINGLKEIETDIDKGKFEWLVTYEDVHMNIESALIKKIGELGKKLHTGRSRNDQVATDIKLYLRDAISVISTKLTDLQLSVVKLAEKYSNAVMPGFTHLQVAQPITFGHHLLAWNEMLERDYSRIIDCGKRLNLCPLGAAALAGTTFPIDREATSRKLGFEAPTKNSLDSVSDRDFAIEFVSCASMIMMHLSRYSEEIILWSSAQFDFIELPDRFCTGSSIMPQKKNPDIPELVRGKNGRVNGHLINLLTLMKSQPLAYNKDNQEDKEPLFDTVETLVNCLTIYSKMISAMKPKIENMRKAASQGHPTATDLADYLVKKGLAFRDSHEVVGNIVAHCDGNNCNLDDLNINELKKFNEKIDVDVFEVLTLDGSLNSRDHIGGTAPSQVSLASKRALEILNNRK